MTVETFFANFGHLADAPNGVQKLRELILQLAVQGKLVLQDANDEPASVLLEKIKNEKLVKPTRGLDPIVADQLPHNIPASWEWARFRQVVDFNIGRTPATKSSVFWDDSGTPWVSIADMEHYGTTSKTKKMVSEKAVKEVFKCSPVPAGTILMSFKLTIGKISLLDVDAYHNEAIISIFPAFSESRDYIFRVLPLMAVGGDISNAIKGKTLNSGSLSNLLFPLPPLEEQKRIVAKVDQLMTLCDELEIHQKKQQQVRVSLNNAALDALLSARKPDEFADHWQRICTNFDLLYVHPETIAKLRAAILQLAVQGKLVPQDPHDEPASVLLERIKVEKDRMVQEGKFKKRKSLPALDKGSAPFVLPDGWSWARFPEVGEFGRGKSKHRPRNDRSLYAGGTYPMVQTGDVARASGEVKTYTALYNDKGLAQSRLWPKGTMCITIAANIADSAILGFDACFPDSVVGLIVSEEISNVRYFEYFIRTAKEHLMDFAPSTAQKNINLGILETVLIPLPPITEIDRIVAKVDQLMTLCDELENKLNQAQKQSAKLMEASVRQLLVA